MMSTQSLQKVHSKVSANIADTAYKLHDVLNVIHCETDHQLSPLALQPGSNN